MMKGLLIKQEIDRLTDDILKELDIFANKKGMDRAFGDDRSRNLIGRSQFNSLLENSRNASSTEELKLLIAYKEAKDRGDRNRRQGWAQEIEGKSVAQNLIESIVRVEKMDGQVKKALEDNLPEDEISREDMRLIRLMLVEKFLGYLYWRGTIMAS